MCKKQRVEFKNTVRQYGIQQNFDDKFQLSISEFFFHLFYWLHIVRVVVCSGGNLIGI